MRYNFSNGLYADYGKITKLDIHKNSIFPQSLKIGIHRIFTELIVILTPVIVFFTLDGV